MKKPGSRRSHLKKREILVRKIAVVFSQAYARQSDIAISHSLQQEMQREEKERASNTEMHDFMTNRHYYKGAEEGH